MVTWHGLARPDRDGTEAEELIPLEPPPVPPSALRSLLELPLLLVVAALVALIVKALMAQAFYIPSESMFPQLTEGDRVVVSRLSYRLHDPRRGDIVVFDDPGAVSDPDPDPLPIRLGRDALQAVGIVRPTEKELIKRIIGLPGESIAASGGVLYIDGQPLFEPYLPPTAYTADFPITLVPEGHVFVMGDNRTNSKDSRSFGPIAESRIVGRALLTAWPLQRTAYL